MSKRYKSTIANIIVELQKLFQSNKCASKEQQTKKLNRQDVRNILIKNVKLML